MSALVEAFSQVNQAQLYVSMSRARHAMHLFTDCKAALHEAVVRPSERVSALALVKMNQLAQQIARAAMQTSNTDAGKCRGWNDNDDPRSVALRGDSENPGFSEA